MTPGRSSLTSQGCCGCNAIVTCRNQASPNPAPGREINSPGAAPHWGNSNHKVRFIARRTPIQGNTALQAWNWVISTQWVLDAEAGPHRADPFLPARAHLHSPKGVSSDAVLPSPPPVGREARTGLQHRRSGAVLSCGARGSLGLEDGRQGYRFWALSAELETSWHGRWRGAVGSPELGLQGRGSQTEMKNRKQAATDFSGNRLEELGQHLCPAGMGLSACLAHGRTWPTSPQTMSSSAPPPLGP